MNKPIIGLTTYAKNEKGELYLPSNYCAAVIRAGGLPILIPPVTTEYDLSLFDGLILTGGGDIHPDSYQGKSHDTLYKMDKTRDALELSLCKQALDTELPLFCICRGIQILNLALGGSIFQHLPDHYHDCIAHRQDDGSPIPHEVSIEAGSKLADILAVDHCTISSQHHQALNKVADCLSVTAYAEDGVIEAVEYKNHPVIGVQWHPEHTAENDPIQQRLFNRFIESIKGDKNAS